jgi:DNA-binding transcriptional regulator/RsmH inhibitor MraZ
MPRTNETKPDKNFTFFTAYFDVNIDSNNRIVIPAHYVKQGLTEECYIVEGRSGQYTFLSIFTTDTFSTYSERYLSRGEGTEEDFRDRKRSFFAGVKHQNLNATKPRITLDDGMREHLSIVKPETVMVIVGVGDSLELWRLDDYNAWRRSERARAG